MEAINKVLEKYNNFQYEQLRHIEQLADGSKIVTLVVQDDDGEDVESVKIEFKDIKHSKILVNDVLSYLDMSMGVSIVKEHDLYGFAIGSGSSMSHVQSAPLYIIASGMKIL